MLWLLEITEAKETDETVIKDKLIDLMHNIGVNYPNCGYGGHFYGWLVTKNREPYYSWGNGSGMRVSPVGWMFDTLEDVMLDFYNGESNVLVCTTIIESGIDIPNANTIIVDDADHFGLSQLYQIKGRVGRGNRLAYAYLMYSYQIYFF